MAGDGKDAVDDLDPEIERTLDREGMSAGRIALLIAAILTGVGFGLSILAWGFEHIPTDVRRLGVLARALDGRQPAPEVAIFGNSVFMSGIDARLLTHAVTGEPIAWNCASTGQTMLEGYLLSRALPATTKTIVFGIFIHPGSDQEAIHPQKFNTLFMYGYRPDAKAIETVQRIFDAETVSLLQRPYLAQVFSSRWAIKQFLDTRARSLLRTDLELDRSTFDLFHPQSYERAIDPSITARFLSRRASLMRNTPPNLAEGTLDLALEILSSAHMSGHGVLFLFAPVHPGLLTEFGSEMRGVIQSFRNALPESQEFAVIDFLDILQPDQFIDDMHPTNEGARILTKRLAAALNERR